MRNAGASEDTLDGESAVWTPLDSKNQIARRPKSMRKAIRGKGLLIRRIERTVSEQGSEYLIPPWWLCHIRLSIEQRNHVWALGWYRLLESLLSIPGRLGFNHQRGGGHIETGTLPHRSKTKLLLNKKLGPARVLGPEDRSKIEAETPSHVENRIDRTETYPG